MTVEELEAFILSVDADCKTIKKERDANMEKLAKATEAVETTRAEKEMIKG